MVVYPSGRRDAPQILCSAGVLESDYSKSLLFVDVENTVILKLND